MCTGAKQEGDFGLMKVNEIWRFSSGRFEKATERRGRAEGVITEAVGAADWIYNISYSKVLMYCVVLQFLIVHLYHY